MTAADGGSFPPAGTSFHLGVAQLGARVTWDHEGHRRAEEPMAVRDLLPRPASSVCLGVAVAQRESCGS